MLTLALLLAAPIASPSPAAFVPAPEAAPTQGRRQPRAPLDRGLADYRAAAVAPHSRIEGSAPAILPDLTALWIRRFAALQPDVAVAVPPPYEPPQGALSSRFAAFLAGRLDFALLTRAMAPSDVQTFRRSHGGDPLVIPVANGSWHSFGFVDPVAILVNAANPVRGLSFAELDALFSQSRRRGHAPVRTWGDLGHRAWRDKPIHVVGAASWAGEDSARAVVMRDRVLLGGSWRTDLPTGASGPEAEVPARVARDPLAIGFTGLGHVAPGTRAVAIRRGSRGGYVTPSYLSVLRGRYPLSRTIDLVVARRRGECLRPELLAFLRFLLSRQGQEVVIRNGTFLPLSESEARASWRLASTCDRGPRHGGTARPAG